MAEAVQKVLRLNWVANLAVPLAVLLLFAFLRGPAVRALFLPLRRFSGNGWPQELERSFGKPLRALMVAAGAAAALEICPAAARSGPAMDAVARCFRSALIVLFAWGLFRLSDADGPAREAAVRKLGLRVDGVLLPFLSKIFRFLVAALAVLMIAQEWSFNISGLLTGLGLGGLAFALAAQDTLSNLFGGLVIFLDRPFGIGDWIRTEDTEGIVEDINFRSVKIRAFSQAVVTVPNSRLVDRPVTNFSRMGKRRVDCTVTLKLGTKEEQLRACRDGIRAMLLRDGRIEPETVSVSVDGIVENGFRLSLYYYTKTADWQEYLKIREEVLYALLRILEREGAELATPVRTVKLENGT